MFPVERFQKKCYTYEMYIILAPFQIEVFCIVGCLVGLQTQYFKIAEVDFFVVVFLSDSYALFNLKLVLTKLRLAIKKPIIVVTKLG